MVEGSASDDARAQARGLILAILGQGRSADAIDPEVADTVLERAAAAGADPLDYCARSLRLGDRAVLENAAHWAGFGFSDAVPSLPGHPRFDRIDHLSDIRTLRGRVMDREITFYAPTFEQLLHLSAARAANPNLVRRLCIVPAGAIRARLVALCRDRLLDEAQNRLNNRWGNASAKSDLPIHVRALFVAFFAAITGAVAIAPYFLSLPLLPLVAVLIVIPALVRLAAVVLPRPPPPNVPLLSDAELPTYSVLIPLRDEADMVPLLQRGMDAIDYPPEKLDIKFVVEEKSAATMAAVRSILDDARFDLVPIPDAPPYTKPKALNYALPTVRGEHVVVFDAEDIPHPGQLRLAASRFAHDPGLDCIQAELVIDNAEENWLTASFASEYAGQFGLMLPLLGRFRLPMPLGGTSNHFRTAALRELGHWDAYNVTEDADLGVRLSRLRYHTDVLDSETSEEAPITMNAWMVQRTRWVKGWMQTFIVHNRRIGTFLSDIGWRNFLFFEIYVGGLIMSSLLHTVFVTSLLLRGLLGEWPYPGDPVSFAYIAILVLGYGTTVALVLGGLAHRRMWELLGYQLLLPVYWVLHSVAAMRAAHQLLVRPYFWGKTAHGRTRKARRFTR